MVVQEALMPFDCAPIIDAPKSLPALDRDVLDFGTKSPKANVIIARPIPAWHASRGLVTATVAGREGGRRRIGFHAAATASCHCAAASARKVRSVDRETRCR